MKKFLCLFLVFMIGFAQSAAAFTVELEQEVDFGEGWITEENGVMPLASADESLSLEERLVEAWTTRSAYIPDDAPESYDAPEGAVVIEDLKIEQNSIADMWLDILCRNPLFFYVDGFSGARVRGKTYMAYIKPKYVEITDEEIEETKSLVAKATEEALIDIDPGMTDFEKVMAVHDYMITTYEFDEEAEEKTVKVMLSKKGNSLAYALAFSQILKSAGINVSAVRTERGTEIVDGKEIKQYHYWNIVEIDGKWYHIDVACDDLGAEVSHEHALLSTAAMEKIDGHASFNTGSYEVNLKQYNSALWRDDKGEIVTIGGVMYRIEGNDIIDENDNVIYKNCGGSICKLNGLLYFNTESAICSYDPETKLITTVAEADGINSLYSDRNYLVYSTDEALTESIKISDVKIGEPYLENGEAVVRLYNDCDEPIWVISAGDAYMVNTVEEKSVGTARFENGSEQSLYVWTKNLKPLTEAIHIK